MAGNLPSLQGAEAGEIENHYLTTYGSIVRWKGPLGVRDLLKTRLGSRWVTLWTGRPSVDRRPQGYLPYPPLRRPMGQNRRPRVRHRSIR